jgi:acetoin utilization deacetylase AcuC-like enzyme
MASLSDTDSDASVNETSISTHSIDAVMSAAGCVLTAIDAVKAREAKNAFCLIRPPGHHAASSQVSGGGRAIQQESLTVGAPFH